jgi:integrase
MSVRLRQWKTKEGKVQEAWWVDVKYQHPSGRVERVRKASPINTRRGAEEYERQIRHALLTGSFGKEKQTETNKVPTFGEFVPRFITYSENNNKHSSVVTKRQILEDHLLPAFGHIALDAIGPAEIEDFKAVMRKKPAGIPGKKDSPSKDALRKRKGARVKLLSLKSVNNVLTVLHKLLALAKEQGVLEHVPGVKLFKTEKPTFDFLTFEEAERLLNATEVEWRTLVLLALKTGLRHGELIGLQWRDVDLQRGKLQVRRTIWQGVTGLPKSSRERTVDLPGSAVDALRAHRHLRGPYVFCQEDGQPLTASMTEHRLTRAVCRAGIVREQGRIGWHDLRHTYGSHLAMRGVPLKVIQELMGHATLEMTQRYAHLAPETRESAVQQLDQPVRQLHAAPARSAEGAH